MRKDEICEEAALAYFQIPLIRLQETYKNGIYLRLKNQDVQFLIILFAVTTIATRPAFARSYFTSRENRPYHLLTALTSLLYIFMRIFLHGSTARGVMLT